MIELPNVTSLYVLLAFGVSYFILRKYFFLPLSGILEAREREERDAQKAYAESLEALEKAVAAGEQKLVLARREALKTREELRSEGAAVLEQKLAEARTRASQEIALGSRQIDAQATESARQLPEKAKSLARELAEKILGRKLAA
jgi:F-type H+-transporting ATPase subunit b